MSRARICRASAEREPTEGDDRGAALVEMALVLPILLALVLGLVSGGVAVFHKITVTNASREAARYGATLAADQCTTTSLCGGMTWAQVVQSIAVERSDNALTVSGVCVALVTGPGSAPVAIDSTHTTAGGTSPCYVDNSSDPGPRVQVSVRRFDRLQAVVFSTDLTLTGRATARFEQ